MSFILKAVGVLALVVAIQNRSVSATLDDTCDLSSANLTTFGYTPDNGPQNWHITVNSSQLCKTGRTQSPILLDSSVGRTGPDSFSLVVNESAVPIELENRGSAVDVIGINAVLTVTAQPGRPRTFVNYHFHTPSEHRVDREYSPVEVHIVFQDVDKKLLVLGFLIELIPRRFGSSPFVRATLAHLDCILEPGTKTEIELPPFSEIIHYVSEKSFYQYGGSLTTPPCSEGVEWYVGTEKLRLDVGTYNQLKRVLKFNARFSQNDPGETNVLQEACAA